MKLLGVDPGLGGGLALLSGEGEILGLWDMPAHATGKGAKREYDLATCWAIACTVKPDILVVERMQVTPKINKHTALALGRASMLWEIAAVACGARLERIYPKQWQQIVGADAGEKAALARARELFPKAELTLAKHSGRAAALLIAESARRTLGGWKESAA